MFKQSIKKNRYVYNIIKYNVAFRQPEGNIPKTFLELILPQYVCISVKILTPSFFCLNMIWYYSKTCSLFVCSRQHFVVRPLLFRRYHANVWRCARMHNYDHGHGLTGNFVSIRKLKSIYTCMISCWKCIYCLFPYSTYYMHCRKPGWMSSLEAQCRPEATNQYLVLWWIYYQGPLSSTHFPPK